MSTTFQIIKEGRVYIYSRRELKFEVAIDKAYAVLQGQSEGSTFNALHTGIAEKWLVRDDVVKPFGVRLENLRFVCTFDIGRDLFTYSDVVGDIQLPLARLREPGSEPPQRSEFIAIEKISSPQLDPTLSHMPHHKLERPISNRRLDFTSRVLSDFAEQWRHILRATYADPTFRRFAKAIINIATCDFQIEEVFERQHIFFRNTYVTPVDVPDWELYENAIFYVGDTTVVLHQDLKIALKIAKDAANIASQVLISDDRITQRTYLLLSVRYIKVCHVNASGDFLQTAPTMLMDGLSQPSLTSIALLLQALPPSRPLPQTPVHGLPLEIQDRILEHVSKGTVEAARLGCILDLGSPFSWMRAVDWPRRGGPIGLFVSPSHRHETTPVESKIYFGGTFSGYLTGECTRRECDDMCRGNVR